MMTLLARIIRKLHQAFMVWPGFGSAIDTRFVILYETRDLE